MEVSAAASLVTSQQPQTFNAPSASSDNNTREVRQDGQDGDTDDAASRSVQAAQPASGVTETLGNNINLTA